MTGNQFRMNGNMKIEIDYNNFASIDGSSVGQFNYRCDVADVIPNYVRHISNNGGKNISVV